MESRSLIRSSLASLLAGSFLIFLAACTRQQAPEPVQEQAVQAVQEKTEPPERPRPPQTVRVTVPQGTEIRLALDSPISSASSRAVTLSPPGPPIRPA
jgi:hypothetical protein